MAETSFEIEGLDELREALQKVMDLCPDFALKQINAAGIAFKRDVISKTEDRTVKRKGHLLDGYKKNVVLTSVFKKSFEAQISGGNKKAHHFHLVENGHEGYVNGTYIGFVKGKDMMKDTVRDWETENKIIPYAEKAVEEAIKKGYI